MLERLRDAVHGHLSADEQVLQSHGKDEGLNARSPLPPELVVYPTSVDEIAEVAKICNESKTPLIPFGFGSSLEGHIAAVYPGSVSLDLCRMNKVLEVNEADCDMTVEAGISRAEVNEYLAAKGIDLFFSPDPGQPKATIGGMVATRCSGTNTVRYGSIRENVLAMKVVLASGKVARLGKRVKKSASGYDLNHLIVGSEGTLAIVAEVTLRLHPIPRSVFAAMVCFQSVKDATECVVAVLKSGVPIAKVEILDELAIRAVNGYSQTCFEEMTTLFFEFHGMSDGSVKDQSERVKHIAMQVRS
jgi:D-lactate dehydrogenase (cytochrome)